ncbi:hypothetical protein [uncultured Pseudoflavonifractor sp.]|uniref:hypothetical protein n=1 Tax=uncultured Pseudoflavonifractor sp. TaxID=1221379 RepID=UPI0025DBDAB5|nr:hypothetical protein [uncultured Pseudoflavonifractor sp.]
MTLNASAPGIVYIAMAAVVAICIALLYFLLHKGEKKKRLISAGCMALCAAYLVWFYFPYRFPADPDNVQQFEVTSEHGISYDPAYVCVMLEPQDGGWLEITEEEAREIVELSNGLLFRRSMFHISGDSDLNFPPVRPGVYSAPENEFIDLRISRSNGPDLAVTCALGEKGFAYYGGIYCIEDAYSRVYGAGPLVEYLRDLAVRYGIQPPEW